ncbi:hypothetical protein BX600DRAFT_447126 [Xylariales sp. PMI_506]|nr:hypothetical protein BX600DRAFT_447126 [Xylariales sp. PMI_506]
MPLDSQPPLPVRNGVSHINKRLEQLAVSPCHFPKSFQVFRTIGKVREARDPLLSEMIEDMRSYALNFHQRWPVALVILLYIGLWVLFRFIIVLWWGDLSNDQKAGIIFAMICTVFISLEISFLEPG